MRDTLVPRLALLARDDPCLFCSLRSPGLLSLAELAGLAVFAESGGSSCARMGWVCFGCLGWWVDGGHAGPSTRFARSG